MIKITVPATSANLGAGFDTMGLAVELRNEVYVEPADKLSIETDGDLPKDENNLVVSCMKYVLKKLGRKFTGAKIKQVNNIPKTSGLGSSAACVVAGAVAAYMISDIEISQSDLINICAEIDGHPDNVVPAIVGGITASVMGREQVHVVRHPARQGLKVALATPDFQMPTTMARKILPKTYSKEDLIYSLSRAVVTFGKLIYGDFHDIGKVLDDKIHTPYRKSLIQNYDLVSGALTQGGAYGVFLSGAGPTIAAFCGDDFKPAPLPKGWTLRVCGICNQGYTAEILD